MSQTEKQIITIHLLPNIWRSKDNQTIKFGQLIEYKIIFFEKSYTKYVGEASRRPFYKKSEFSISVDQQSQMLCGLIFLYAQVEDYQKISKVRYWSPAFIL